MPSRFLIVPVVTYLSEDAEGYIEVDDADWPRRQVNRIASAADNLPFSREGWLYASDAHPALLSDQRIAWSAEEETVGAAAFEALWAQAAAQERVRARLPMLDVMITLAEAWAPKGVSPLWDPELVAVAHTIGQTTSLRQPIPEVVQATQESRRRLNGAAAAVHDRSSLAAFITALAEDRSDADRQEQQHPNRYAFERAHGWEVTSLSAYLWALAQELEAAPTDAVSWAGLAQVLLAAKGRTPMDGT